jgi:hypothetical protein
MTPVQRAKAKVDFDLRKARAFDSDLQGKDDEAHWERFRFDRFAKPELSVTDLPSDDDEEPAVKVDFEAAGPSESTVFVGQRAFSATRGSTVTAVATITEPTLTAEERHEHAIFGTPRGAALPEGSVPPAATPDSTAHHTQPSQGQLAEFASEAAIAAAAAPTASKSGWRARLAAKRSQGGSAPAKVE